MEFHEQQRVLSLLAPGEFEAIWLIEGELEREPIVGWALVESWMCRERPCSGRDCFRVDEHADTGEEVKPVLWADSYAEVGIDHLGNGMVAAKSLPDDEARSLLEKRKSEVGGRTA